MNETVSVVVPIYKVENYLSRCIESIVKQTYKNLEIILVNDGSPDNCGMMAEQYAKEDSRIKVLHKENGGLSDARNYGMSHVTGDFTIFVDSDDWLDEKLIERLMAIGNKFQADVVQAAFYYAYDDYLLFDSKLYPKEKHPIIYHNKELMKQLVMNERVKNFAWGKLYKTKLIKDIPFKKGVLFEDVFWAHLVMQQVNTFVLMNEPLYYYYQREDSIVANYSSRNLDIIKGLLERHDFIENHYRDLSDQSYKMIVKTQLIHYNLLLRNREKDYEGSYRKEIEFYLKTNYSKLIRAVEQEKLLKRQLKLFRIHPYFNILLLIILKVLRKINVINQPKRLERIELKK
ncbi:glycosyltransferase family 2 protein [Neobacillus sp. LXY-1]|uniref:glycosyltransferase family 2 protein n=1 Tax=Neobacillus sp. LXY-1 TaxID=3379133 RepID=UPI003EDF9F9C